MLKFSIFDSFPELVYGLSEIADGSMKDDQTGSKDASRALANRHQYFSNLGFTPRDVVAARLTHGSAVHEASRSDGGVYLQDADAIISHAPEVLLTVTVADCFPVYLYDPDKQALGLVHAGWRGIASGIMHNTIQAMEEKFGSDASSILIGIGPGIQSCHFEVQTDVADRFAKHSGALLMRGKKIFVDLGHVLKAQVEAVGIASSNIALSPLCTYDERTKYFSYRRNLKVPLQAMVAYVGIKKRQKL